MLWHILVISLQISGVPWPLAVLIVLAMGVVFGLLNGLLVEVAQIDSFIANPRHRQPSPTRWRCGWTGGRQIIGRLSPDFFLIDTASIGGIPLPAFYVIGLAFVLWLVSAYNPARPATCMRSAPTRAPPS